MIERFLNNIKNLFSFTGKRVVILILIFSWIFSGWPQIWNFPPKVSNVLAGSALHTSGSGSQSIPAGATNLVIEVFGGGGGGGGGGCSGGGCNGLGNGGGGGGGYSRHVIASPATSYSYSVGAGGGGGAAQTNGSPGGASTVDTTLVVANGGNGGTGATVGGGAGGAGATAGTGNQVTRIGGNGAAGTNSGPTNSHSGGGGGGGAGTNNPGGNASGVTAGAGGSADGGAGGTGSTGNNVSGSAGSTYGGGGAGSNRQNSGADGAAGAVRFTWDDPVVAPTVTTQAVSSIGENTATGNGNVTSDGGATVTERGVVANTTGTPTTSDLKFMAGAGGTGAFTASMTSLDAETHYYVRAYAINSVGTSYGEEVEFDTNAIDIPPTVTLNSPADEATGEGSAPTLNFTGTDTNGDTIEYNVQIDTSIDFNSVSGSPLLDKFSTTDAGFTSGHPFTSGEAKEFTVQSGDELSNGIHYWRVRAIDPTGSNTYGAWSATRSFTVTVAEVSISLSTDGSVQFGTMPQNTAKDTTSGDLNDPETIQVDSGPADLEIKSTNFSDGGSGWSLGSTSGSNTVKWEFSKDGSNWIIFELEDSLYPLDTNVSQSSTRSIYFRITAPTDTNSYQQHSAIVTIVASAP